MAANNEEERILSIKVKYQDAINGILEYQNKLVSLKAEQEKWKKEVKEGTVGFNEYNAAMADIKVQMAEAKDGIRVLEKEARNNLKTQKENEGSLKSLRAELSNSTKAYDEMSRAEREGAEGKKLQEHINEITNELKDAEEKTQRFYRNVGNYENSVKDALASLRDNVDKANEKYQNLVKTQGEHAEATRKAKKNLDDAQLSLKFATDESDKLNNSVLGFVTAGNPWAQSAINFVQQLGSIRNGFILAKTGAMMLGKQLLVLMANPIVAFLAGLSVIISLLVKGISSSEESMNRWKVAMAPIGRLLDGLTMVLQKCCGVILSVVEAGGWLLGVLADIGEKLPIIGGLIKEANDTQKEAIELAKEEAQLAQQARIDQVQNAKDQLKVAELRQQAKDKEKFTAKERLKFVQDANKLEEAQAKRNVERVTREFELLKKRSEWADNDKETNDKLAELEAAKFNAEKEYFQKTMELLEQENTIKNEIAASDKARLDAEKKALEEKKKAAEEYVKVQKERADKEIEAIRQAEDAMLSLVKDGAEKQRQQIVLSYGREIEDLKKKLAEEKNLTQKAKDAINQTIKAKEQQKVDELQKLSDEELQKNIETRKKEIELELEVVQKGSDEEYDLKIESLKTQRDMELAQVELTENMKALIREKYRKKEVELEEEHQKNILDKQTEVIKQRIDVEITLLKQKNERELREADLYGASDYQKEELRGRQKIEQARMMYNQKLMELENMRQMEGESDEEFHNRQLVAAGELSNARIDILLAEKNHVIGTMHSMQEAFEMLGESNKAFAKLSKVLALAEIAINTGEALAYGIKQAQTVPFPANLAAIATTVATILANVAKATKMVNSAKFASGGLVEGPGSGTSDSIPAQLSNGESVMTAAATSMFSPMLSAFNQMGGGVPIMVTENTNNALGEEMLANAVAKGMRLAPRPVVSVEEFNTVSRRVEFVDRIGDI